MNIMKKYILFLIVSVFVFNTFAQDSEEKDQPVSSTFESGYLIDNQTIFIPDAKTLEFVIQHKFGTMDQGFSDLFGIYAPGSNIRLGLNYVPVDNLQIGIGVTKKNMYTDFNAKWSILKQTKKNTVPVSVALFGSFAIDGRNASAFGSGKIVESKFPSLPLYISLSDRFSYFSQLIIGRKFTDWLSLQVAASYTHYNMVEWDNSHRNIGVHVNGRIKVSPQGAIVFNYDHPLKINEYNQQLNWDTHSKPNLAFGFEIATFTHAFQIYVGTADGILPQDAMMYNRNDWKNKGLAIGFNITRLWMF
jgi:hypothetical protein